MIKTRRKLEDIWHEVPVDYYQKGVASNFLQRSWHRGRLKATIGLLEDQQLNRNRNKALDVGCASGWFISEIARHFPGYKFLFGKMPTYIN